MAPLRILICGGGIAGPALAYWLSLSNPRSQHMRAFPRPPSRRYTDRSACPRDRSSKTHGPLSRDPRKAGRRSRSFTCRYNDNIKAKIMAKKSGKGAQGPTSEYEIMRGDLVRILYDATKDEVKHIFNTTVDRFEQDEQKVLVRFSDNTTSTYDLLVGADGQNSRIRRAVLPLSSPDPIHRLGLAIAYYFIPRTPTDNNIRRSYHSPGGRLITRRNHNPTETRVYLFLSPTRQISRPSQKLPSLNRKSFGRRGFGMRDSRLRGSWRV